MAQTLTFSSCKHESGHICFVIGKTMFIFGGHSGDLLAVARGTERYCVAQNNILDWQSCTDEELQEYATRFLTEDTGELIRRVFSDRTEKGES